MKTMTKTATRIYVAAPSPQIGRARDLMAGLAADGFEVVSAWPERIDEQRARGRATDADVPVDEMEAIWTKNMEEVARADVFIMLAGDSNGAHAELGYAIAKGDATGTPFIIVVGVARGSQLLGDVQVDHEAGAVIAARRFAAAEVA